VKWYRAEYAGQDKGDDMNLIEILIERGEKRLKRIDENPDTTKLKSNRLGFELDLGVYKAVLNAWKNNEPILPYFPSPTLARALGSQSIHYEFFADQLPQEAPRFTQAARDLGLPGNICDTMTLSIAAAMIGELPPPAMISTLPPVPCRVWTCHMKTLADYFKVPEFVIDTPQECTEESIVYLADQFQELIKFAESNVPGLKYNQDRHIELLQAGQVCLDYTRKEWNYRRQIPLPIDSKDSFRQPFRRDPGSSGETAKVVEYWRLRTGEIEKQLGNAISKKEKLRILWVWGRPIYLNPMDYLEPKGVVVPAVILPPSSIWGNKPRPINGPEIKRELSPLEIEAMMWLSGDALMNPVAGGRVWAEDILWACHDLQCDAIVYYQLLGCIHMGSLAKLVVQYAEKENIPALIITGRELDASALSPADFKLRLNEFVDMVIGQKEGSGTAGR
jgi:hypothetical protein